VVASRLGGCSSEVHLVVNVVASVGSLGRRRVDGTTSLAGAGEEDAVAVVVRRQSVQRTAKGTNAEDGRELAQSPVSGLTSILLISSETERSDGADTLEDVAENVGDIEVGSKELRSTRDDNVGGVDLEEGIGESLDSTVRVATAVPVLGPLLGNVLEVASLLIELPADNGGHGLVVGNTSSTIGTVAEELRVEGEGTEGDDLREGEGVEEGVVLLAEVGAGGILLSHGGHVVLAATSLDDVNTLLDEAG